MKIVINTKGTYVSKHGECFRIRTEEQTQDIAAKKIEQMIITTGAALTTDALELAVENNVDVVFLKGTGKPFGRVWHSKMGSISTIRRKQLLMQDTSHGLKFVKEWIGIKMKNQANHLNELGTNRRDEERKMIIKESIEKINNQIKNVEKIKETEKINEIRNTIQGYEGSASRAYFSALSKIIPKKYEFSGRSKNPAKDYFNCMLNYGYGIMYSNVERACIIAGLDPYIGIMHTDNYNRTALVFDLIEVYRVYIEKIIFKLFSGKKIKKELFDEVEGGYYLNKKGKELLIGAYNEEMEKKIKYKGRNIELQNIIQFDAHNIANKILKEM